MPVGATQHQAEVTMVLGRDPHGQLIWLPQPASAGANAASTQLHPGQGQPMVLQVGHTGTQSTVGQSMMGPGAQHAAAAMTSVYSPHGQLMQPPHSGGGPIHLQEDSLRTAGAAGLATNGPLPLADAATAAEIATTAEAAMESRSKQLDPGSIAVNPSPSGAVTGAAAAPAPAAVAVAYWPPSQMPPLAPRPLTYQYPGPANYYFPGQPYYQ